MPDFAVRTIIGAVDKFSTILGHMGVNMGKFGERAHGAFALAERGASIFKGVLGGTLLANGIQRIGHEVAQLPKVLEDFAEKTHELGRTAGIIGTSADAWQRWIYTAKLTDTSAEALQGAMQKLNRNMADLTVGKGTLMDLMKFGPKGLATAIRGTHDTTEAMLLLADSFQKVKDPQVRARMAVAAFGKAGQEMIPMLSLGREGIHKLMREASIYGSVLDDSVIENSERTAESLKRMRGMVGSLKDQVLGFVVKGLGPYLEKSLVWLAANKEIIAIKIEDFITRFANALRDARPVLQFLWNAAGWLIKNWPLLLIVYGAWTAAQLALDAAMLASGIPEIVIGITAMIAAIIMVIKYWKEITGALQSAWNWFDRLYNKSLILRNALFFLAGPVWLVVEAIRTLIDLISGRGLKSFENFIPPWLKGATDKLGITQQGANQGGWASGEAPNKGMGAMQVVNNVSVDNSRAPGVKSEVRTSQSARGNPGMQYAMGTP